MSSNYDVIIIGAGIMGCNTALQLARHGMKVVLFDKDAIGAGPSGRSSAIVRQHYSNRLTARMARYSLDVFQDFSERVGGECGYTRTGFACVVAAGDQDGLAANVALQKEVGIQTDLISIEALAEIMPAMAMDDLASAAYEPDGGFADPYLTVTSYAAAARRAGVDLHQGTEVTNVRFDGDTVIGVDAGGDRVNAPIVLNCGGPWGRRVAQLAGEQTTAIDVPIDSCRVQVAFFRRPTGYEADHPVVADFVNAT